MRPHAQLRLCAVPWGGLKYMSCAPCGGMLGCACKCTAAAAKRLSACTAPKAVRARRQALQASEGEVEELRGHVIICGFGRVGQTIGQLLAERLIPFVAVDVRVDRVQVRDLCSWPRQPALLVLEPDAWCALGSDCHSCGIGRIDRPQVTLWMWGACLDVGCLLLGCKVGVYYLNALARAQAGKALDLPVYFGDAGSPAVLHSLGAHRASCAVITLDTPGANYRSVWALHKHFPHVKSYVRAHDVDHGLNLEKARPQVLAAAHRRTCGILGHFMRISRLLRRHQVWLCMLQRRGDLAVASVQRMLAPGTLTRPGTQAGATAVVPETLEPGLQLASAVLSNLNMPPDDVQEAIQSFRRNHLMELQVRSLPFLSSVPPMQGVLRQSSWPFTACTVHVSGAGKRWLFCMSPC